MARVPGSNLLKKALTVIAAQTVTYHAFSFRTQNEIGQDIAVYKPARVIKGSIQPVPRAMMVQQGLEMNSNYVTFYASKDLLDVKRDVSGDQIVYDGKRYQCLDPNDWFSMDGWVGMLCVMISEDKHCA